MTNEDIVKAAIRSSNRICAEYNYTEVGSNYGEFKTNVFNALITLEAARIKHDQH